MAEFVRSELETKTRRRAERGFTLLEVMIVAGIIIILAGMAAIRLGESERRAHEAALHQDLAVMRQAIQNYTLDKEAAPNSLDDLQLSKYIGEVPTDPITRQKDWVTESCTDVMSPDQIPGGICDVHSASDSLSSDGTTTYDKF
jgi:general secretion pathway protein G